MPCRSNRQQPKGWKLTVAFVLLRDRGVCHLCGLLGADTADHVLPWSKGGADETSNLRAAHKACNRKRGNHALPRVNPKPSRFG